MIVSDHQDILTTWLCDRIGLVATPDLRCLGRVRDGKLIAVVGFDGWNGASCQMHCAGDDPRWINRDFLSRAFSYPFDNGYQVLIVLVPSGNKKAIKLNKHLGFSTLVEIPDAHPDGSLLVMSMPREACRWIKKGMKHHGQEIRSAASA